jgi:cadmium resistance protein CadD (predicted permease)
MPLFREAGGATVTSVAVFFALVAVWLFLARWLAARSIFSSSLDRWGHWLVPLVYIAIGSVLLLGTLSH